MDSRHGGGEQPCGGFDAALLVIHDETHAMVAGVLHFTNQPDITNRSGPEDLANRRTQQDERLGPLHIYDFQSL